MSHSAAICALALTFAAWGNSAVALDVRSSSARPTLVISVPDGSAVPASNDEATIVALPGRPPVVLTFGVSKRESNQNYGTDAQFQARADHYVQIGAWRGLAMSPPQLVQRAVIAGCETRIYDGTGVFKDHPEKPTVYRIFIIRIAPDTLGLVWTLGTPGDPRYTALNESVLASRVER